MQDNAPITCPNPLCQTPNPASHRFCKQCCTLLPKRYLWAVGKGIEAYKPGKLVADRYLLKHDRILLDTKPGFDPLFPTEVSDAIAPYLRLFPYQPHLPQLYGFVLPEKKGKSQEIWLLEQVPIYGEGVKGRNLQGQLMPELVSVWRDAAPMRQLNWLWQMAQLWQPLHSQGVASSLLNPKLLCVEGSLVRLLELSLDRSPATLADLGQLWGQWVGTANPAIAGFLQQLCQEMIQAQIQTAEEVVQQLDRELQNCGRSLSYTYQIITRTDTGPSRQRNEDACYPPAGSFYQTPAQPQTHRQASDSETALAIVCDGIGGHEGGNVASNLAIETVQKQLEQLSISRISGDAATLTIELEQAVCAANDRILQRNDTEQRQDRQRMGTTLVMGLAHAHEVYITHIGDSRAYWIGRTGCHQLTTDDDIASREVRLGYALYREALQQMGAGALVQALGMNPSKNLYPSIERFVVDEDCLFLLCSDGLSDSDRVEQYWDTELLPLLEGKIDLETAASRLIEIANAKNGHDNVTVALVYCQVRGNAANQNGKATPAQQSLSVSLPQKSASELKTRLLKPQPSQPSLFPLLTGIVLLLGLGGFLAYLWIPAVGTRVDSLRVKARERQEPETLSPVATPTLEARGNPTLPPLQPSFSPGTLLQVKNLTLDRGAGQINRIVLQPQPGILENSSAIAPDRGIVPAGSLLQILSKQATPGQEAWLRVRVCTVPPTSSPQSGEETPMGTNPTQNSDRRLQPGDMGWIRETEVASLMLTHSPVDSTPLGSCAIRPISPTPDPTQSSRL